MIEYYLLVVFFFLYIDGVLIFRFDIFTIVINRVMVFVIYRIELFIVFCYLGIDIFFGRRSLVIVREFYKFLYVYIYI